MAESDRRWSAGSVTDPLRADRAQRMVASMAPQFVWPSTTTNGVPNCAAANSTLPTCEGATIFPATRITNRSPRPWSKTISAGTRASEQPSMMAKGACAADKSLNWAWVGGTPCRRGCSTNRSVAGSQALQRLYCSDHMMLEPSRFSYRIQELRMSGESKQSSNPSTRACVPHFLH